MSSPNQTALANGLLDASGRSDALTTLRRERLAAHVGALFGASDTTIVDDLLGLGEWVKVLGGTTLFRQGDPGDSMYLVLVGRLVAVCEDGSGRARVVGHIRPGESVGEMGLLAKQPRTATVQASRDTVVVRISERSFEDIVARHPGMVAGTARLIIRRTADVIAGRTPADRAKSIAIVPMRPEVDGGGFVERLRRALESMGPTLVVDRARADAVLSASGVSSYGDEEARNLVLSTWLDEQELRHDSLLYRAEATADPWTERCIRQADLVLLLARVTDRPELRFDERRSDLGDGAGIRRELVLVHPPGSFPAGRAAAWVASRQVARHHHVRWNRDDDFDRLARFVHGDAIGLVLGGGGARGFAHLGVLRALREEGIPIDAVGGTSQGAVVAASIALDWDDATIERVHRDGFTHRNPIGDWALFPHVALVKGRRLDAALERCFGGVDIEDTWLSFFCVSSNLSLARAEVHRSGRLWRALRASVSLPGILPPAVLGDHLHVDGAILDNLPIDAMRASGVGRIIAVDLTVKHEVALTRGALPSPIEFVKDRLFTGGKHPASPGLGSIVVKAAMMSSIQRARELEPGVDLFLEPAPAEIGFLDWKALDRGIELGYGYAKRELARHDLERWRHGQRPGSPGSRR